MSKGSTKINKKKTSSVRSKKHKKPASKAATAKIAPQENNAQTTTVAVLSPAAKATFTERLNGIYSSIREQASRSMFTFLTSLHPFTAIINDFITINSGVNNTEFLSKFSIVGSNVQVAEFGKALAITHPWMKEELQRHIIPILVTTASQSLMDWFEITPDTKVIVEGKFSNSCEHSMSATVDSKGSHFRYGKFLIIKTETSFAFLGAFVEETETAKIFNFDFARINDEQKKQLIECAGQLLLDKLNSMIYQSCIERRLHIESTEVKLIK
jgi:hypothetical protein